MASSTIQRYLEAGVQFTEMSKKQAEELVKHINAARDKLKAFYKLA